MPMWDLNTDEPEESILEFQAGEPGELGLYIRGGESATIDLAKSETAIIWWRPDRCDDSDAWEDED